jgi:hypothetical protein
MTSAGYGGRDARLGIDDLVQLTGLARRTVKAALAVLIARGLLVRIGRYRRLRVNLGGEAGVVGGATSSAPPTEARTGEGGADEVVPPVRTRRGADKVAPPRCKQGCPSTTTICVSSLKETGTDPFTPKQKALIADVFSEATGLLGSDAALLAIPEELALAMGLAPPISYGEAFEAVARAGDRAMACDYTGVVLALRRDDRVQGRELL